MRLSELKPEDIAPVQGPMPLKLSRLSPADVQKHEPEVMGPPEEFDEHQLGLLGADPADPSRSTLERMDAASLGATGKSNFSKEQIEAGKRREAEGLLAYATSAALTPMQASTLAAQPWFRGGGLLTGEAAKVGPVMGRLKTAGDAMGGVLKTAKEWALPAYVIKSLYKDAKGLMGQ